MRRTRLTVRPTALGITSHLRSGVAAVDTAQDGCKGPRPARTGRAPTSRTALRSVGAGLHILVLLRGAGADAPGRGGPGPSIRGAVVSALAPLLQAFFTDRLVSQRGASGHTIAAYRDTFRLLLVFTAARTGKQPHRLDIAEIDAPLIAAFLHHLEHDRGNQVRTRNNRLAAIS